MNIDVNNVAAIIISNRINVQTMSFGPCTLHMEESEVTADLVGDAVDARRCGQCYSIRRRQIEPSKVAAVVPTTMQPALMWMVLFSPDASDGGGQCERYQQRGRRRRRRRRECGRGRERCHLAHTRQMEASEAAADVISDAAGAGAGGVLANSSA
ncbi:hypothetical protein EVAR_71501_1 [Eumeta japonica]|uniref:Uncharacterized protein n=1 Tax=Eumeta variegata TaxID=151549 RepID=A0A4C2ACL8_EUMVA|nr:hypothetical protein EVAR_71501_1 [Eumeta japonica]